MQRSSQIRELILVCLVTLAADFAFAANGPAFSDSFPRFDIGSTEIVCAAPTNRLRTALWVYKVVPQSFSGTMVSNLMALGSFTIRDQQKWTGEILPTNTKPLMFGNVSNTCNLLVVPGEGRVSYFDYSAPANRWDRTNHLHEQVKGLPSNAKVQKLGIKFLEQLSIKRSDLAQRPDGHLITFGTERSRSYFDRRRGKYIENEVTERGVYFNRQLDGISFAGIGIGGGAEIIYGNRAKISSFRLVWRNLQRDELRPVASPEKIIQRIRDGEAVLTHKNIINPSEVKKLTIKSISPLYMGASGSEAQDFVYPFAQLEAIADLGITNIPIQLYCPILSE